MPPRLLYASPPHTHPFPLKAVVVGARYDAYVPPASVRRLHEAWPGSRLRWVDGGHVSSFVQHPPAFREAILESLVLASS